MTSSIISVSFTNIFITSNTLSTSCSTGDRVKKPPPLPNPRPDLPAVQDRKLTDWIVAEESSRYNPPPSNQAELF